MREIKFRGQRVDTKEWVYGMYFITPLTNENVVADINAGHSFLTGETRHCISTNMGQSGVTYEVIPETVGQFTGYTTNKTEEVYDGDVVYLAGYGCIIVEFPYHELYDAYCESDIEYVIGNIHKYPKLS